MDLGKKLKNLRVQQDLTQEELADRSEVTKGFISQVERNLTSPSVATLIDILEALGTNPSEFFEEEVEEKIVFQQDDYFESIKKEKMKITWIVPNAQKNQMEPTIISLKQGAVSKKIDPFEGEVFGYVLKGEIQLYYGSSHHQVGQYETFYFQANKTSFLENTESKLAEVLCISSPPSF